ncbi:MAG: DUF2460 domain-containing protein [Pseudomonadota bacterium]
MDKPGFHDILFPLTITTGATGGPRFQTEVTPLASGGEVRQTRWSEALRQWDVAGGVTDLVQADLLQAFFQARQGRRYAFRFRDPLDHSSAPGNAAPSPTDQSIGTGDGVTTVYPLTKTYGSAPYTVSRIIDLVDQSSLLVAVDGITVSPGNMVISADGLSAVLSTAPGQGASVTAGFLFDVPVRFDSDDLSFSIGAQGAALSSVVLREVRL